MSLDVSIIAVRPVEVFEANFTHNLNDMADAVGLYLPIWHPEQLVPAVSKAQDLIPYLEKGLARLINEGTSLKKDNPKNGGGTYDQLVEFVYRYLNACRENSDGEIRVCP